MCGIAGFQGGFDAAILPRMCAVLTHRGPDNQAFRYDATDHIGLVHTRLSIIDLSPRSNQPVWDSSREYCIVFNGEIYNYQELRRELCGQGVVFTSDGDAEVILNLYVRHGRAALARLNGIFAFAIWHKLSGELFIARDQFGVKPLYYAQTPQGVVFASELKALLCATEVSRELDYTALWQYLTLLWAPAPHTPLAAVRKLEPGHFLLIKDRAIQESGLFIQYPVFELMDCGGAERATARLRELLAQAVQRQLVADVPVGAFLSGGVDSSALAYFAAAARGGDLQCFTVELEGAQQEGMQKDLPFAKLMAQYLKVPLEVVQVTPNVMQDLPRMLFALDEPQADPAPLNSLYIAECARERNIKVLLSGAGGDDLFAGYRRHYALLQEPLWSWMPMLGRRALSGIVAVLPRRPTLLRRISKAFEYAHLPEEQRITSYFYWIDPRLSLALLNPFVRTRLASAVLDEPLQRKLADGVAGPDPLNQMLYLEQKFFLPDHNFNYTDKTGMAAGVEIRVPFMDPDLVGFANRLPGEWKYRNGQHKWLLKETLRGLLPDSVLRREKTGFGAPLRAWLRGPLRPWVDEMLAKSTITRRGIFDYQAVKGLLQADRHDRVDASYTIFSLICIEMWARQFIDPPTPTLSI